MYISFKVWFDTCNKVLLSGLWYRCLDLDIYTDLFTLICHKYYIVSKKSYLEIHLKLNLKKGDKTRSPLAKSVYFFYRNC